jgi:hypothetical protein
VASVHLGDPLKAGAAAHAIAELGCRIQRRGREEEPGRGHQRREQGRRGQIGHAEGLAGEIAVRLELGLDAVERREDLRARDLAVGLPDDGATRRRFRAWMARVVETA